MRFLFLAICNRVLVAVDHLPGGTCASRLPASIATKILGDGIGVSISRRQLTRARRDRLRELRFRTGPKTVINRR
jgi:hypothetical protein